MPAITAATATAIAAGTQLVGAGASFAQAAKQNRLRIEAENAAKKYMEKAVKAIKTNYAEDIQVPLEAYEMANEANTQATAQALEAMRESGQRAIIGGVAGVQQQAQAGSEQLRLNLQQDLEERNRLIANEDANIRDKIAGIDLTMATGAEQAAADAQALRAQSTQSGFAGLAGVGATIYEASDLYTEGQAAKNQGSFANLFGGSGVKRKAGATSTVANPAAGVRKPKITLPTRF